MTYGVKITEAIESLKEFADFLAANFERLEGIGFDINFGIINVTEAEMAALIRCPRPFDNRWMKDGTDSFFHLTTNFGAVEFDAYAAREEVCRAVPTGRTVTQLRAKPVEYEYEEVEVPEMEWICEPVLTAASNGHVDSEVEVEPF